ncbi:Putative DNA-binding domain-containing protein [Chitinophaga sp. CF118]|uniref:HvfC/BufC N-terminal domain-containing protein n=1 Tax=Chitinophaga sp. CF118 TaxID=1884367 RepID=UPI0008EC4E06|nr:DNA-binding domain-containing protein [Chitinophaga sp. CF118]SFD15328.1 Putative DNA-binding domain-containing protein [Chitinophaga sp. CF118]
MSELAKIQKWLTSIIIKPGRLNDKIGMADQFYQLNHTEVIRQDGSMSSGQKIEIYAKGYILRLMECMTAEYPILLHLLGEKLFNTFARSYLVEMPPVSTDLYDLGLNFPAFLKASQPKNKVSDEPTMLDLPVELAQLERALAEVSRCKGLEGLEKESTDDNQMLYLFDTASFKTSPCLVLLQLHFPLTGFIKSVQHGEDAITPGIKESFVAISRKNYIVHLNDLELWQWQFLKVLQSNNNYLTAISIAAGNSGISNGTLMAELMLWIPIALRSGYIYRDDTVDLMLP